MYFYKLFKITFNFVSLVKGSDGTNMQELNGTKEVACTY
jgi:hypothetical protein